ncbi:MAG: carboxymuconolactone decarboxylase family protein [Acidimicrobiia bacterium]
MTTPPDPGSDFESMERGRELMKQVYGWDIGEVSGDFVTLTVGHLFGNIWARDSTLSIRERRLMLIGLMVGQGLNDVVQLQLNCARSLGELTDDELREIVIFLSHYAGWPRGAQLNTIVETLIAKK